MLAPEVRWAYSQELTLVEERMVAGLVGRSGVSVSMGKAKWLFFVRGIPPPQFSERLGYIILWSWGAGWVTEEGLQESGHRQLDR